MMLDYLEHSCRDSEAEHETFDRIGEFLYFKSLADIRVSR
jgi:hypothetical protein